MTVECKSCGNKYESESKLNTHVLLEHPELARENSDNYTSQVSDGHMSSESNAEKGEQFGYE